MCYYAGSQLSMPQIPKSSEASAPGRYIIDGPGWPCKHDSDCQAKCPVYCTNCICFGAGGCQFFGCNFP